MALPSAQLGSLPSFGMPNNISTQVTHKQPKLWEQALMQLITQAGGQAIQQGVTNAMSPDFSETPNTGWSKLMSGPKVSRADQAQTREITARATEGAANRGTQEKLSAAGITAQKDEGAAGRALTKEQNDLMRQFQAMMAERANMNQTTRDTALSAQDMDKLKFQAKLAQDSDTNRDTLLANNPNSVASRRVHDAQADAMTQEAAGKLRMQEMLYPTKQDTRPIQGPGMPGQPVGGVPSTQVPQSGGTPGMFESLNAALSRGESGPPAWSYSDMMRGIAPPAGTGSGGVVTAPDVQEMEVLNKAPFSTRAQEIRLKYGIGSPH